MNMQDYRSAEINHISAALAKAQGSYEPLVPNQDTAGGKFANIEAILKASRQALSANGLSFYQYKYLLDEGAGALLLITILSHESGQWISSHSRIIAGQTLRETANAIADCRKIDALLLLGIAPVGADPSLPDDNGVEQAEKTMIRNVRNPAKAVMAPHQETISKDEYDDIMWELEGFTDIVIGIQKFYNISTIADLPKTQYHAAKAQIRKIKKTHEEYALGKLKE